MSDLSAQITDALKEAMRSKDTTALTLLRSLKSAIKYAAIEKGGADAELDEAATVAVIRKEMGAVMKLLQERSEGRADNKLLSAEVAKRLS